MGPGRRLSKAIDSAKIARSDPYMAALCQSDSAGEEARPAYTRRPSISAFDSSAFHVPIWCQFGESEDPVVFK